MDFITNPHNPPNQFYQNQGYSFDIEERKTLIIDQDPAGQTPQVVNLFEPLIIDKLSDVYLESFTTHGARKNNADVSGSYSAFVVDIKEFNINSNSNTEHLYNKIVIPNEEETEPHAVTVHKSKKLNYICSINPTKLSRLNITITGLSESVPMFHSEYGRYILELLFISRK